MMIIKSSFVALVACLFCIWLLRPLAIKVGLVDRPGGRKLHDDDIPLTGGIAMFFGFCFALLFLHISLQSYRGLLAGSALLMLIGVVDDFKELSSHLRLVGQLLASLFLVIWGHLYIQHLGNVFFLGSIDLGLWGIPLTVIGVMGYINSMNMIDGQDGLAGGVALGQTCLLFVLSLQLGRHSDMQLLTILAILLLVFLSFNMPLPWRNKAKVFMGDSGITFVAFLLAWFAIDISHAQNDAVSPITLLWIFAFPIFDMISVSLHRIQKNKSPFLASRDHLHHVLSMRGVNIKISTVILCLFSIFFGFVGMALRYLKVSDGWQLIGLLVALGVYFYFVKRVRLSALAKRDQV